jgi:hypothetical protein
MLRSVAQMIQLTYQPAFDAFHTAFRFLRLRASVLTEKPLSRDHFRILDFYLLYPFRSGDIRLMQGHRRFKKIAQNYSNTRPYGDLPEDRVLLRRMLPIQTASLDTLARNALLDSDAYRRGLISRTGVKLPAPLQSRIDEQNSAQSELLEFLRSLGNEYELLGPNGLKDRSGLMEWAHDAV